VQQRIQPKQYEQKCRNARDRNIKLCRHKPKQGIDCDQNYEQHGGGDNTCPMEHPPGALAAIFQVFRKHLPFTTAGGNVMFLLVDIGNLASVCLTEEVCTSAIALSNEKQILGLCWV
jgi:hypothetical protein